MADDQITVKIAADTADLKSGLDDAAQSLNVLPAAMKDAEAAAGSFSDSLSEVAKVAAGVFSGIEIENFASKIKDGFSEAILGTAQWAEELEHLSLITGSSVAEIQELQGVSELTGTSIDRLVFFTQRLNQQFAAAASGSGSKGFAAALKDLNLKESDFSDTTAGIEKLSQSLQRIGITSQRAREDLSELGGRGALALLPLLANLPELIAVIDKMGLQSEAAVAKESEFQRALNALGQTALVTARDFGGAFAPVGTAFEKLFINIIDTGEATIKTIATAVIDILATVAEYGREVALIVKDALTGQWGEIGNVIKETGQRVINDQESAANKVVGYWTDASKKIAASFAAINLAPPTGGKGGTAGGFQGPGSDKAAIKQFEDLRAELALEVAETGKSAAQKLALEQAFVEKVRQIRGLPLKDLLEAFASEEKAWQAYLASVLKDQLDNLANSETITKAQLSLQQANDQAQMASATQAAQLRLAAGTESRLAELADQMSIDAQKVALEQKTENDQYAALRSGLEQRLAALKASGIDETEAIHKAQADLEALELTHQAKLTEIATKGATDRSKLEVQSITEQMKQLSGEIGSLLEPISRGFDQIFSGVLQGTQSASQAFRKMALDMGLALAQSGIKDLLLGGGANTIGAKLFGQSGQGGGIAGMIAQAFGGPAVTGALTNALRSAFASAASFIGSIFKTAMSGAASAAGAAGGAGGGQSAILLQQMVTGIHTIAAFMAQQTIHLIAISVTTAAHLAVGIAHAATAIAHLAAALIQTIIQTLIAAFSAVAASPKVLGTGAAGGAFTNDMARGAMRVNDGKGGFGGILHPNEVVLNPEQTAAYMSGQRDGGSSSSGGGVVAGHTVNISFGGISAIDSKGVRQVLSQHADHISNIVQRHLTTYGGAYKSR